MTGSAAPLDGVRVVELGVGLATPLAARMLGDLGADVIKVETLEGDRTRSVAPFYRAAEDDERSALFEYLNYNKRGVSLDPGADRGVLDELLSTAQVLLIGDDFAQLATWGLDVGELRAAHPDLVIETLTPYGITGPKAAWKATDLTMQAASGLLSFGGNAERYPLKRGLRQSTFEAGLTAAYVAEAALLGAREHGGTVIDISIVECIASELVLTIPEYAFTGAVSTRRPTVIDPLSGDPLPAGPGYVSAQITILTPISNLADFIGDQRLAEPQYATPEARATHAAEVAEIFREALADVQPRDFFEGASERGILAGFVQTADQLLECPHLNAREVFRTMPGTLNGRPWRMPAVTASLSRTGVTIRRAAPLLGEHTSELVPDVGSRTEAGAR
ncbi:MAG TPA: CoA transferase [Blastococcus sp.]|jgi:crotonobetainyl-CoA:carnitine CoA-transferase CaiB-like acyl-CoA transferase|nr:CoA transferase [Blastococcus sp.]